MTKAQQLMEKIKEADYVLVGFGEEFNETFEQIGMHTQLMDLLKKVDAEESLAWTVPFLEKAYLDEQQENEQQKAYENLYDIIKDKNYFIVSTCIDGIIEKTKFDLDKVVQPCGNYKQLQCSKHCSTQLYPSEPEVTQVVQALKMKPAEQVKRPVCPNCGAALAFNNILCENYVEEGYLPQWEKYTKWLSCTLNRKLCILELGVGMDVPSVIRWPFEKVGFFNLKASFFRVHETLFQLNEELAEKGISIEGNACSFLKNELTGM